MYSVVGLLKNNLGLTLDILPHYLDKLNSSFYLFFRSEIEKKIIGILKGLGKLVHKDISELMDQNIFAEKKEQTYSLAAVNKWKTEYDMFLQNVDAKIQQQKDTFNLLRGTLERADDSLGKINKTKIDRYEWAVRDLWCSWHMVKGNIMRFWGREIYDDAFHAYYKRFLKFNKHAKKLDGLMNEIGNMMQQIRKAFDVNVRFGKSSIEDFEPTHDFQEALKRSSTFMKLANGFQTMKTDMTKYVIPELFEKMSFKRNPNDPNDLIRLLNKVAFHGEQLVNQVNICLPINELGSKIFELW